MEYIIHVSLVFVLLELVPRFEEYEDDDEDDSDSTYEDDSDSTYEDEDEDEDEFFVEFYYHLIQMFYFLNYVYL